MNHHSPSSHPTDRHSDTEAAKTRKAMLAAANHCLKLIYQRRRQMARFARWGDHVRAWEEYREILKAKDRRRWFLARLNDAPILFLTEDAS